MVLAYAAVVVAAATDAGVLDATGIVVAVAAAVGTIVFAAIDIGPLA